LYAPLAEVTRLQAIWYEGRLAEAQAALPEAVREIKGSGYRHHAALVAAQYAVVQAMVGDHTSGRDHLTQARAAAVGMSDAPLVDTSISVAEAALAAADGDDIGAAAILSAYVERRPVGQGLAAAAQQRHLALSYVSRRCPLRPKAPLALAARPAAIPPTPPPSRPLPPLAVVCRLGGTPTARLRYELSPRSGSRA